MIEKSANQLWKESGTTLSFKDWLNREKKKFVNFNGEEKGVLMVNKPLNDTISSTISEIKKSVGYKDKPEGKSVFGINKYILIVGAVALVGFVTYKIIKSRK